MGRPERHDADYFPFYVKDGKTLFILESKYGLQGIGFFTNVMRFLTRQTDHHICIKDDSDRLYFFAQIRCPEDIGIDMLNLMAKTGKIDLDLWEAHRVIVSKDLIESLRAAYKNRNNKVVEIDQIRVSYSGNGNSYQGNPISSVDNPQTKLKETKVKKKKEVMSDENWLKTLEDNPIYEGIEVRVLYGKMLVWCESNGKKPTRRRFVNWLNREEKPLKNTDRISSIDEWARKKAAEGSHGAV